MQASDGDQTEGRSDASVAGNADRAALDLQERERLRIGFDLHDGPVQTLASALLCVRMMRAEQGAGGGDGLLEVESMLTSALDEMYALIEDLRSRSLEAEGIVAPVRTHALEFSRRHGIEVKVLAEGEEVAVSRSLKIAVFRIVQEALSNVARHSGASTVDVTIKITADDVECIVKDDGCGFLPVDSRRGEGRNSFGLMSMRERARLLDGVCEILSEPGAGTVVSARIPIWHG